MLVDEYDSDILPLLCEPVESIFYGRLFCFVIYHKEIPLRVRWFGNVANTGEKNTRNRAIDVNELRSNCIG